MVRAGGASSPGHSRAPPRLSQIVCMPACRAPTTSASGSSPTCRTFGGAHARHLGERRVDARVRLRGAGGDRGDVTVEQIAYSTAVQIRIAVAQREQAVAAAQPRRAPAAHRRRTRRDCGRAGISRAPRRSSLPGRPAAANCALRARCRRKVISWLRSGNSSATRKRMARMESTHRAHARRPDNANAASRERMFRGRNDRPHRPQGVVQIQADHAHGGHATDSAWVRLQLANYALRGEEFECAHLGSTATLALLAAAAAPWRNPADARAVAPEPATPFSVQDLVRLERISEAAVSPDGKRVAYTLRTTDMDANKGRTAIWLVETKKRNAAPVQDHRPAGEFEFAPNGAPTAASSTFSRIAAARARSGASRPAAIRPRSPPCRSTSARSMSAPRATACW